MERQLFEAWSPASAIHEHKWIYECVGICTIAAAARAISCLRFHANEICIYVGLGRDRKKETSVDGFNVDVASHFFKNFFCVFC